MRIHPFLVASLAISFASAALHDPVHNLAARAPAFADEEGGGRPEPPRIPVSPLHIPPPSDSERFTPSRLRQLSSSPPVNYGLKRIPVSIFKPRGKDAGLTSIWTDDRFLVNDKGRIVHAYYGPNLENIANIRIAQNGGKTVYNYRPVDPKPSIGVRIQRRWAAFTKWVNGATGTSKGKQETIVNREFLNTEVDGISPYEALTEADMMRLVKMMTGEGDTVSLHFAPKPKSAPKTARNIYYRGSQKYVSPSPNGAEDEAAPAKRARLVTFADEVPPRKDKRDDVLTSITTDVGSSTTANDATAEFTLLWDAFHAVQSNISDTIFPFLDAMINNTNSSLLYEAAWSIWADLTASNEYTAGPFSNGMHSFDALEDAYLKANNVTEDDPTFQNMLVVNAILLDSYTTTWTQAFAAVNGSGLIQQLQTLAGYLLTNDTAVAPASFYDANQAHFNDNYFLVSNHNTTATSQ